MNDLLLSLPQSCALDSITGKAVQQEIGLGYEVH